MSRDLMQRELETLRQTVADLTERLNVIAQDMLLFELPAIDSTKLTPSERAVVKILHDHAGKPVDKRRLFSALYAARFSDRDQPGDKIIDVFICKVRRKLAGTGWEITTHWGMGYALNRTEAVDNGV